MLDPLRGKGQRVVLSVAPQLTAGEAVVDTTNGAGSHAAAQSADGCQPGPSSTKLVRRSVM